MKRKCLCYIKSWEPWIKRYYPRWEYSQLSRNGRFKFACKRVHALVPRRACIVVPIVVTVHSVHVPLSVSFPFSRMSCSLEYVVVPSFSLDREITRRLYYVEYYASFGLIKSPLNSVGIYATTQGSESLLRNDATWRVRATPYGFRTFTK